MNNSEVEGWTKYVTAGIALFEVVEDDLLPIKPIGIQVVGVAVLMCWSSIGSPLPFSPLMWSCVRFGAVHRCDGQDDVAGFPFHCLERQVAFL